MTPTQFTFSFTTKQLEALSKVYSSLEPKQRRKFESEVQERFKKDFKELLGSASPTHSKYNVGNLPTPNQGDFLFVIGPLITKDRLKSQRAQKELLLLEYGSIENRVMPKYFFRKILKALNSSSKEIIKEQDNRFKK